MLRVGLTGGIGAGKSAVARRLAQNGAVIIDADLLAREVVAPGTSGLAELVDLFGPRVLTADGELDRQAVGARVFADESARRQLEQVIHPRVRARTAELTRAAPATAIVVNDVPLLVETGLAPSYQMVVVVESDQGVRIRRLVESRGMTPQQAAARIAAQTDDATRRVAADVVLRNDKGLPELNTAVDLLFRDRLRPFEEHLHSGTVARPADRLSIVAADPDWPVHAARLIARLRHVLGADTAIEHIGSTAVPGVPAKDVIDLMLAVRTLAEADEIAGRLTAVGFPRRQGEWADNERGVPGHTWPKRMHGTADPGRPVNLHVRVAGTPGWRFALLMRDHLRTVAPARADYAAARAAWAAEETDRCSYGEAKEAYFDSEARAAHAWAESTGWQPS